MKLNTLLSFLSLSISVVHAVPVPTVDHNCSLTIRCQNFGGNASGGSGLDSSGFEGDGSFDGSGLAGGDTSFSDPSTSNGGGFDDSRSFDTRSADTTNPTAIDDSSSSSPTLNLLVNTTNMTTDPTDSDTNSGFVGGGVTADGTTAGDPEDPDPINDPTSIDFATNNDITATETSSTADDVPTDLTVDEDATATDPAPPPSASVTISESAIASSAAVTDSKPISTTKPASSPSAATPPKSSSPPTASVTKTCPPAINTGTISLIKQFEGFVASPLPDPIGLPTVDFGHKCQKSSCAEFPFSFPLSQTTAAQLLQSDIKTFTKCVNNLVSTSIRLNDNQFGALSLFASNLGCGSLQSSTLLKRLNAGEDQNTIVAQEIPKFNKAGGKVLARLTRRRNAEVSLFLTNSSTIAHPCN